MTDVKAIAAWTGWCSPCGTERPLSLTEVGPRGLRAWLRGLSWEDRELGLYCRVCGVHQVVPLREQDDPVVAPTVPDLLTALTPVGRSGLTLARPVPVAAAAAPTAEATPAPTAAVPAQRAPVVPARRLVVSRPAVASVVLPIDAETSLDLVAAGLAVG